MHNSEYELQFTHTIHNYRKDLSVKFIQNFKKLFGSHTNTNFMHKAEYNFNQQSCREM